MGYFDGLAEAALKTDKNGNTVFYPWGVLGKGRVLAPDKADELRRFLRRYYQVALPISIVLGVLRIWPLLLLAVVVVSAWYFIGSRKFISGTLESKENLTFKESYTNAASRHSKPVLWLLLFSCIIFIVMGIFIAINARRPDHLFIGLGFAIFSALCSLPIAYMVRAKYA